MTKSERFRLHPESMKELRQLLKLHGRQQLLEALDIIQDELDEDDKRRDLKSYGN